jgi:hypothetical protein
MECTALMASGDMNHVDVYEYDILFSTGWYAKDTALFDVGMMTDVDVTSDDVCCTGEFSITSDPV